MAQGDIRMNEVLVAPTSALNFKVTLVHQFRDDPLSSSFRDSDACSNIPNPPL